MLNLIKPNGLMFEFLGEQINSTQFRRFDLLTPDTNFCLCQTAGNNSSVQKQQHSNP